MLSHAHYTPVYSTHNTSSSSSVTFHSPVPKAYPLSTCSHHYHPSSTTSSSSSSTISTTSYSNRYNALLVPKTPPDSYVMTIRSISYSQKSTSFPQPPVLVVYRQAYSQVNLINMINIFLNQLRQYISCLYPKLTTFLNLDLTTINASLTRYIVLLQLIEHREKTLTQLKIHVRGYCNALTLDTFNAMRTETVEQCYRQRQQLIDCPADQVLLNADNFERMILLLEPLQWPMCTLTKNPDAKMIYQRDLDQLLKDTRKGCSGEYVLTVGAMTWIIGLLKNNDFVLFRSILPEIYCMQRHVVGIFYSQIGSNSVIHVFDANYPDGRHKTFPSKNITLITQEIHACLYGYFGLHVSTTAYDVVYSLPNKPAPLTSLPATFFKTPSVLPQNSSDVSVRPEMK